LDTVADYHGAYCKRHGLEYQTFVQAENKLNPWYNKIVAITSQLEQMASDSLMIYLDSDSLVVDLNEDITKALPDGYDLGLVPVCLDIQRQTGKYNNGVMFIRVTEKIVRLFKEIEAIGKANIPVFNDQRTMNKCLKKSDVKTYDLESKYNCYEGNLRRCYSPIIRSWHGKNMFSVDLNIKALINEKVKQFAQ